MKDGLEETVGSTTLQNNRKYKYNNFIYIINEPFLYLRLLTYFLFSCSLLSKNKSQLKKMNSMS